MLVGIGYDVHKLVKGRSLILGGVDIPYDKGLLGHSDADVLVHAVMDALLGAVGQGDIGKHFPDSDEKFKGVSSLLLLNEVYEILCKQGYRVNNIDSIIVAQKPKLAPYIEKMRANMAEVLQMDGSRINVKATTTEGLGFTGTGEGIAAHAISSIDKI